jgi:hypothetical protein
MKKRRNIFLKIFLLTVLFCFQGINAHSNLDALRYDIEISHNTDNSESKLNSYNESSIEDQIDQSPISDLSEQAECQIYCFKTLPLLNILIFSVWQPPKVF